jgi:predicted  nucleic acid-binding Zn-ribbon protein
MPMKLVQMIRDLQEIDQEWDEKGRLYSSAKQQLGDESPLEAVQKARSQAHENLRAASAKLRNAELELETLQQKAQEVEGSLYGGRVRAFKELEDLRQEGEHIKTQVSSLEDNILQDMDLVDDLRAEAQRTEAEMVEFESHWKADREALLNEYKELRTRLQQLQAKRKQLRDSIPQQALALYDEVRQKKGGLALAPMEDGRCLTCRVAVPSSKVQAVLTDDTVILCEGCDRILYRA